MPSQLLQYLPAIYTEALQDAPFLGDYLQAFEQVLLGRADDRHTPTEGLEQTIADLGRFFDPDRAPEGFLSWLASWVALSLRADLSPKQQRQFIANMVQLYRGRGTKDSLHKLLEIFTAFTPTITEEATQPEFQLRVHSTIGLDTYLSGGRPHRFQVTIDFRTLVCVNEVLPLTIGLRDERGNPAVSEATEEVQLTSWEGMGTSATTWKAQVYIPAGKTARAFYYKRTIAGNVSLVAESLHGKATLAITVIAPSAADATQLAIVGDTLIPVGEALPLTIVRRDVYGNPAAAANALTVALTFQPPLGACTTLREMDFERPIASVTIPPGETSTVILYKADQADAVRSLLLRATAERLQPATQTITVTDRVRDPTPQLTITGAIMAGALSVARQSAIVQALIELEKPAHTDYELALRYPTMQLGVHSTVGLDTLLTPIRDVEPEKERVPHAE